MEQHLSDQNALRYAGTAFGEQERTPCHVGSGYSRKPDAEFSKTLFCFGAKWSRLSLEASPPTPKAAIAVFKTPPISQHFCLRQFRLGDCVSSATAGRFLFLFFILSNRRQTSPNMLKTLVPRTGRSLLSTRAAQFGPANLRTAPSYQIIPQNQQRRRGYASEASEYDVLFIGGGVAGYVGAIKAGQEGLRVSIGSSGE